MQADLSTVPRFVNFYRPSYTCPKSEVSRSRKEVHDMEQDPAGDRSAPTAITKAIQALLDRRGIPERKRLGALEAAVGIAYQQVRRRMMGDTTWSVDEIKRLAAHFGEPVFRLLGALVEDAPGEPAVLQVGGAKLACSVWPGPEAVQGIGPYVAIPGEESNGWTVVPVSEAVGRRAFEVRRLIVEPEPPRRVAVVDDDDDLGRAIVQFLRQKGLDAISYTSAEHLRTALETTNFDGFILDWVLGEEKATALLPLIRAKNPAGPVIILTGQIDAGGDESDLASALTTFRAQLYEKPSRTLSLFNALELGFQASPRAQ